MSPLRKTLLTSAAVALLCLGMSATTKADEITLVGPTAEQGTGFGTVFTLLTLHNNGTETGTVSWNGSATVTSGHATNQSHTYSFTTLANAGLTADNFGIVYNINETGPIPNSTSLDSFTLNIYNANTGALVGTISLVDTGTYDLTNQGVGGSGYLFTVVDTGGGFDLETAFANPSLYVLGASGSISLTDDGPETFYVVNTANPVPEPTTMLLLGTGLAGIAARVRRRRKAARPE